MEDPHTDHHTDQHTSPSPSPTVSSLQNTSISPSPLTSIDSNSIIGKEEYFLDNEHALRKEALVPDDFDIYMFYEIASNPLPPPNNFSPWITFVCRYPDHIFHLRKFLRCRKFHKQAINCVPKFASLQMEGSFHDHGATLFIHPVWILSPTELKRTQTLKPLRVSEKRRHSIQFLVEEQLEQYMKWVEQDSKQVKRTHCIRVIDHDSPEQMQMLQSMLNEGS